MSQDLPRSWQWAALGDLCTNHDGKRVPVRASDRHGMRGQYPYYGASGVIDHVNDYLFEGTYLLISEDGANLLARSKPIAFEATGRFWVNNHAHVVTALDGIVQRYLMHAIDHSDIGSFITGSAQPKITQRNLSRVPVPVPPTAEQERIVTTVEEHFSRLNGAEASLVDALRRMDLLRASILAAAFEVDRRPQAGWSEVPLRALLAHTIGGVWGSPPGEDEEEVRVIRVTELADHGALDTSTAANRSVTERQLRSRQLRPGDLILEKSGGGPTTPVGRIAHFEGSDSNMVCTNFMQLLRPDHQQIDSRFLHLLLHQRYVSGATAAMNKGSGNIRNLETAAYLDQLILVPPRHAQIEAVDNVSSQLDELGVSEQSVRASIERTVALRRSILAVAFAGRLVPQNPDDEPASVLLERLAAYRPTKSKTRKVTA